MIDTPLDVSSAAASIISQPCILVVDDIAANIDVLSSMLKPLYRVKVALNAEKALSIAFSQAPDLILLDIMMPDMDGYELCRQLKQDPRTCAIPIIFVTAKSESKDEEKGFEVGALDYITKPFSPPIVLMRVKTQLALYNQNRLLADQVSERTQELMQTRFEIINHLGRAAEYKDNETGLHVIRMSYYAYELAIAAGLKEDHAELIRSAAPMHDIGKIGISDHILTKPGRLDEQEREAMCKHPEIGAEIMGDSPNPLLHLAHSVALNHHEKWDGSGYPRGLKAEEIPIEARIVALADVFDALTSVRPYKPAWSCERALELFRAESGKHFEPKLVEDFIRIFDRIDLIRLAHQEKPEG